MRRRKMMIETFERQFIFVEHSATGEYCWSAEFPHYHADKVIAEIEHSYPKVAARYDRFNDGRVKVETRSLERLLSFVATLITETEC